MKKIYSIPIRKSFLVLFFLICSATVFSQKKVSGKVTDGENNSSVPGATVQVKGTNKGVNSDVNGNYTVIVPNSKAILLFSFVGYLSKEVCVGSFSHRWGIRPKKCPLEINQSSISSFHPMLRRCLR